VNGFFSSVFLFAALHSAERKREIQKEIQKEMNEDIQRLIKAASTERLNKWQVAEMSRNYSEVFYRYGGNG
jgi:N-acetylglucosamine kinase-like BadF-type ATPase